MLRLKQAHESGMHLKSPAVSESRPESPSRTALALKPKASCDTLKTQIRLCESDSEIPPPGDQYDSDHPIV
jgi:hypothetical protein